MAQRALECRTRKQAYHWTIDVQAGPKKVAVRESAGKTASFPDELLE
jgi:hypothetical protein